MTTYKKIAFLVPRAGMTTAAFQAYWAGTHGPTVAGSPGYGQWRLRYVQNHVLGAGPVGGPFGFAGSGHLIGAFSLHAWRRGPIAKRDSAPMTQVGFVSSRIWLKIA